MGHPSRCKYALVHEVLDQGPCQGQVQALSSPQDGGPEALQLVAKLLLLGVQLGSLGGGRVSMGVPWGVPGGQSLQGSIVQQVLSHLNATLHGSPSGVHWGAQGFLWAGNNKTIPKKPCVPPASYGCRFRVAHLVTQCPVPGW